LTETAPIKTGVVAVTTASRAIASGGRTAREEGRS